jgi:hypothetical protein
MMANVRAGSPASAYLQAKEKASWRVALGRREDWAAMSFIEHIQTALMVVYYNLFGGFGTLIRSFRADNYRGNASE